MSTDAINGTPNSLFDICKHDITGICTSTTESVKSFLQARKLGGKTAQERSKSSILTAPLKTPQTPQIQLMTHVLGQKLR